MRSGAEESAAFSLEYHEEHLSELLGRDADLLIPGFTADQPIEADEGDHQPNEKGDGERLNGSDHFEFSTSMVMLVHS